MSRCGCLSEMPPGKCTQCGDPTGGVSGAWRNWLWLEMASPNAGDPKTLTGVTCRNAAVSGETRKLIYVSTFLSVAVSIAVSTGCGPRAVGQLCPGTGRGTVVSRDWANQWEMWDSHLKGRSPMLRSSNLGWMTAQQPPALCCTICPVEWLAWGHGFAVTEM